MSKILLFLGSALIFASCNQKHSNPSVKEAILAGNEYQLVWQDEFNYQGLPDSAKWKYDTEGNEAGWGNNEGQFYTEANIKNASVSNGILKITAIKENFGGKAYTSARLVSNADWKYGKIEINPKLPKGRGTWAPNRMMPGNWSFNDGKWPDVGEIDFMEHVGHDPGVVHTSAHSRDYQWQKGTQKTAVIKVPSATEAFNTYVLEWTPDVLKAFVNDSLFFEYRNEGLGETKWPYDKPFYLILNVAVGGEWGNVKGIDDEAFPQTMEIDYVRVYQKNNNEN